MARERIAELLADYAASGLSMAAYARREGIKYPTFANWVKRGTGAATANIAPRFAEVRLSASMAGKADAALSVTLPNGLVLRGSEPLALAALARVLLGRA